MKWSWFSLSAFTMSPCSISTLEPLRAIFSSPISMPLFCDGLLLALLLFAASHLFFILLFQPHTTLPWSYPYFVWCQANQSPSLHLSVPENDYGRWLIRWFMVCIYMCGSVNDGMWRDRWKVRHGAQMEASVCHLLSTLCSTGCVTLVSSLAQFGTQYLQPGIIRRAPVSFCGVTEGTGTLNYASHFWICSFFDISRGLKD